MTNKTLSRKEKSLARFQAKMEKAKYPDKKAALNIRCEILIEEIRILTSGNAIYRPEGPLNLFEFGELEYEEQLSVLKNL